MSESKHTPTPWEFEDIGEDAYNLRINQWERMEASKVAIAIIPVGYSEPFEAEQRANAAFIVKAVNAYEPMVEALLCILREAKNPESFKYDLQAIASNMLSAIGRHPDSVQP